MDWSGSCIWAMWWVVAHCNPFYDSSEEASKGQEGKLDLCQPELPQVSSPTFPESFDILWYPLISFDILWYPLISFDILWYPLISFDILLYLNIFWEFLRYLIICTFHTFSTSPRLRKKTRRIHWSSDWPSALDDLTQQRDSHWWAPKVLLFMISHVHFSTFSSS